MDLEDIRKKIDGVDKKLVEVLEERIQLVDSVAEFKKKNKISVLNEDREKAVLDGAKQRVNDPDKTKDIAFAIQEIMELSKIRQNAKTVDFDLNDYCQMDMALKTVENVTIQGVYGSYSTIAAKELFKDSKLTFVEDFKDVFLNVKNGIADVGILPLENSLAGSVNEVYDFLREFNLYIMKAKKIPINHCLLGIKGTKIEDIKTVYSHEQALYQCRNFLNSLDVKKVPMKNTAIAGEYVSTLGDKTKAAVASKIAAESLGLEIIKEGIENEKNNYTRFIAVTKEKIYSKESNKISLIINLPNKQGALYRLLNIFAFFNVNINKIESRPIPNADFEFSFYFDFVGNIKDENIQSCIKNIKTYVSKMVYLGNYVE